MKNTMNMKIFTNRKFRFCSTCSSKQTLRVIEKDDWKLGAYHCPKCNADTVDSFVLVDYHENGCRIVAKKMKAYDLFNRK